MVKHICPRCGYCSEEIRNLRRHLQRETPCIPSLKETTIEECLSILDKSIYKCECGKEYKYMSKLKTHKSNCEKYNNTKYQMNNTIEIRITSKKKDVIVQRLAFEDSDYDFLESIINKLRTRP